MNSGRDKAQSIAHHREGCVISLAVSPRSSANRVEIDDTGAVRIRLTAPPVDGAANMGLLKFLASVLHTPRSNLTILTGAQSRHKRVLAAGIKPDAAWAALSRHAGLEK